MNSEAAQQKQYPVLVLMGVSGSGKSTVGGMLAGAMGWDLQEGDDLHPQGEHRQDGDRASVERRRPLALARQDRRLDQEPYRRRSAGHRHVFGTQAELPRRASR